MADNSNRNKITPVAEDWNWTNRIRAELGANKVWQRNWGFLLDHPLNSNNSNPPAGDSKGSLALHDSLSAFMQSNAVHAPTLASVPHSYIAAKQRDSLRARRQVQQDSLDGFVNHIVAKSNPLARALPAEEFKQPLTTNQNYGWGRNLEVFGKMTILLK